MLLAILLCWTLQGGQVTQRRLEAFGNDQPAYKAMHLLQLQVYTLVGGAISRLQTRVITAHKIELIPFFSGRLPDSGMLMPRWCRNRRLQ